MHTLLPTLREEFTRKIEKFSFGVERSVHFPEITDKILVAIGMRRVGKTYLLFQTIKKLLDNVPLSRILYINFEDDRLFPTTEDQLRNLIDSFYTLYPENHDNLCYLFFDEIQNVDNWHRVIRRYFDTKNVKIYLTGSSAKLLSKEIATSLRGRSLAIEVWPFSFSEFMAANQLIMPNSPFGKVSLDQLKGHLNAYLTQGGFPETIYLADQENRFRILQDYVSAVIFRDIVERYKITNLSLIKYMIKMLLKNVGCSFSTTKLLNDLKSQLLSVSKTTILEYLSYIQDSYLAFTIPLYAESIRKMQTNPRKIYAVDTGLVKAYSSSLNENTGHHFENLVYLDLKRAGHEVYYYLTKSRREVDFLSRDLLGNWHLNQVCWRMDDKETVDRELQALSEAEQELGIKGSIITPDSYFTDFLNIQ